MSKEASVVNNVSRQLKAAGRYFINCFGDGHGASGQPDILTMDSQAQFCGIECKQMGKQLVFTQLVAALDILKSGGRATVAYPDFDLTALDNHTLPHTVLPSEYEDLFDFSLDNKKHSQEFVLEDIHE